MHRRQQSGQIDLDVLALIREHLAVEIWIEEEALTFA
jgi:hypothetical protein